MVSISQRGGIKLNSYLSPTGLSSYSYCPRLCYLNQHLPYSGTKTEFTVLGSFEHEMFAKEAEVAKQELLKSQKLEQNYQKRHEEIFNYCYGLARVNYPQFLEIISNNRESILYRLEKLAETRQNQLKQYLDQGYSWSSAIELVYPLQVEYWLQNSNLGIRGRTDTIYKAEDGTLIVEDIKSHTTRFNAFIHESEHKTQLVAYAILAEAEFQLPVNAGRIFFSQDLSIKSFQITDEDKQELIQIKNKVANISYTGIPDKLEGKESLKCSHCYKKEVCFSIDQKNSDLIVENYIPIKSKELNN